jgi:hypothetical protein
MKRAARKQREAEREEKAASQRKDKEEIFEVRLGCILYMYKWCAWLLSHSSWQAADVPVVSSLAGMRSLACRGG